MTVVTEAIAKGEGWSVRHIVCSAGPDDRPYEERHEHACLAIVRSGSFRYRAGNHDRLLGPGSVLLGEQGQCYECGHRHGVGDACLSFSFTAERFEELMAGGQTRGRRPLSVGSLPPSPLLHAVQARAEAALVRGEAAAWDEIAVALFAAVIGSLDDADERRDGVTAWEQGRVSDAARRIEQEADQPLSLTTLSEGADMNPLRFLRVFKAVMGMTPYRYLLRSRMHRAATQLIASDAPVSAIAYDAGFGDLSTFNRRFRRTTGASPTEWRARWAASRLSRGDVPPA